MDAKIKHRGKYTPLKRIAIATILGALLTVLAVFPTSAINLAVSDAEITVNDSTTVDNATLWKEVTLKYALIPTDRAPHYVLATASNPRNRTCCFVSGMNATSTTRYFDVECGTAYSADYTETYTAVIRTYIEQITSGYSGDSNYRSGVRISVRLVINGYAPSNYKALNFDFYDVKGTEIIDDVGATPLTVHYNYTMLTTKAQEMYAQGYADGYAQMDASGLSAEQTAFGVISAPINAVANVIQSAVEGWFSTPVGAVSAWIVAILAIGGVVLFIVKVVIG